MINNLILRFCDSYLEAAVVFNGSSNTGPCENRLFICLFIDSVASLGGCGLCGPHRVTP